MFILGILFTDFVIIILFELVNEGKGGRFSGGFDINVFQKVHGTGMS